MNEDDYEMSQFVIGFDGGGSDQYDGSDEGGTEGLSSDIFLSPPPPKFLLPPPPLPDFMQPKLKSIDDDCDVQTAVFNLQHHLETCDINYVSNVIEMHILYYTIKRNESF